MTLVISRRVAGVTGAFAAALSALYAYTGTLIPAALYSTTPEPIMPLDLSKLGQNTVKRVPSMEVITVYGY